MKTILYKALFLLLTITTGCKSIDKLVDQGRYDEAIVLATKKLAGKKNKKTKHIRALEEAFAKVNDRDMQHISYLKSKNSGDMWSHVYDYALRIGDRQDKILPFLPLVSKENYVGSFELINTANILGEARTKAAEYAYLSGKDLLDKAKSTDDKLLAQEAHYILTGTGKYYDSYKNSADLIYEANEFGTFHILLKWDLHPAITLRESMLSRRYLNRLDQRWIKYHLDFDSDLVFDAISTLRIDDINISREREVVNHFSESKDLKKWIDKLDADGNAVKDSSGNIITYMITERVEAVVSEYLRTKNALFSGSVELVNFSHGSLISHEQFNHAISFETDACTIVGDKRAISDRFRKRIDNTLLPFPTDYEMIDDGVDKISNDFIDHLDRLNTIDLFSSDVALR